MEGQTTFNVEVVTVFTSRLGHETQTVGERLTRTQTNTMVASLGHVSGWRVGQRYRIGFDQYVSRMGTMRQFVRVTES